ncbi:PREDICTED: cell surface [Prunus dulcis]|uniref:PREDICTED: cell surface n=2 Tax=Prunus dulcis TaxID=3755 RepID=A0A5E4EVQ8_PRUDU|nr:PREDICTED: cell surface [Prunus dulcis]VVA17848.1 PREDICTED: cell surface [Prunus dulcis]
MSEAEIREGELPAEAEIPEEELPAEAEIPEGELPAEAEIPEGELPAETEIPEGELPAETLRTTLREQGPDEAKAERSSGSENRPSRLAPLDFGQEFFKTSLEDILHEHSVSARGRVYDDISFNAAKLKLQSLMFPRMTIGNSGIMHFLIPGPLMGMIAFKDFLDACMGVFAHSGMSAAEFVVLNGPGIGRIAFKRGKFHLLEWLS